MFKQLLTLFFAVFVSAHAKYYAVDKSMQIKEIPVSIADFVLHDPNVNAYVEYRDDRNTTGWVYYYYKSSSANPDWLQMYLAGYLEGYSAYYLIWDTYTNMNFTTITDEVMGFIHAQLDWITEMIENNPNDSYWIAVNVTLAQLHGIYDGFQTGIKASHRLDLNLTFDQFYLITYESDLGDVVKKFTGIDITYPSCSFLAKMTNESLYVSHTTWYGFTALLRVHRVLDLSLQSSIYKTKRITYTGLPGAVPSQDDYYMLDDARVVTETSLENRNAGVYGFLHTDSVPYWIRITVANLLSTTQQEWVNMFFAYRSGTYNNQWLLIDFKNYNASKNDLSQAQDIIWMVEEFYNLTSVQDVTQELLIPQGYVASYNIAYNEAIYNLSKYPYNYTNYSRAILFEKYAPGIQDLDDFKYVMRLNNISDTGDYCQAISCRCDLNPTTVFPWGAVDCKVTSEIMAPNHQAWIISGPSSQNIVPFTWNSWPQYQGYRNGMPTTFEFDWVYMDPNTNYSASAPEHGGLAEKGSYAFIMESRWVKEQGLSI